MTITCHRLHRTHVIDHTFQRKRIGGNTLCLPLQGGERRLVFAGVRQQGTHSSRSAESGSGNGVCAGRRATAAAACLVLGLHAAGSRCHVSTAFHGDRDYVLARALSDRFGTHGRSESAVGVGICGRLTRQRSRPLRNCWFLRHRRRLGRRGRRRMLRLPMIRFHLCEIVNRVRTRIKNGVAKLTC